MRTKGILGSTLLHSGPLANIISNQSGDVKARIFRFKHISCFFARLVSWD
jgi:hypothetical protein